MLIHLLRETPRFVTELLSGGDVVSVLALSIKEPRYPHSCALSTLLARFEHSGCRKGCLPSFHRETVRYLIPVLVHLLHIEHFGRAFAHIFLCHVVHLALGVISLRLVVSKGVDCGIRERIVSLTVCIRYAMRN